MHPGWGSDSPAKQRHVIILTDNRSPDSPGALHRLIHTPHTQTRSVEQELDEWSLDEMRERMSELQERVSRLEQELTSGEQRRRGEGRKRRAFKQIQRYAQCQRCERKYGSETALKLHLKIKHPEHQHN